MKRLVVLAAAAAALVLPATALASGGVVLKVQKATHLVAVSQSKTKVSLVHTTAKLRVGQRVAMRAKTLRNGTLAASSMRVVGRARTVHFRGLLLARTPTRLVVSAGGAVVAVKRASRTVQSARDDAPKPGSTVDVTATVGSDDELDQGEVSTVSADAPGGSIEGKLTLGTGKITVVSEHMALAINVPAGFDLSGFQNGDEVLAVFAQQADGTLLLTSLSGDRSAQEADQPDQGDQGGDGHDGGDD